LGGSQEGGDVGTSTKGGGRWACEPKEPKSKKKQLTKKISKKSIPQNNQIKANWDKVGKRGGRGRGTEWFPFNKKRGTGNLKCENCVHFLQGKSF